MPFTNLITLTDLIRINKTQVDSPVTLIDSDCNGFNLFTNNGATGTVIMNLPKGEDGLRLLAIVGSNVDFSFVADGVETIRYLSTVSRNGGSIKSSSIGDGLQLDWSGTQWIANILGTSWVLDTSLSENIGSDLTKQRFYETILIQALNSESIEWVFRSASENLMLGKVINNAFNLGVPEMDDLHTFDEILSSSIAISAILSSSIAITSLSVSSVIINAIDAMNINGVVKATGGDTVLSVNDKNIHIFNNSGTLSTTDGGFVEYLVVGGGGGGSWPAGGGGGGVRTGTIFLARNTDYSIVVGSGGTGGMSMWGADRTNGINGQDSIFSTIVANGGGGGGSAVGLDGSSGGGGGVQSDPLITLGGNGIIGQGYDGGSGLTDSAAYNAGGGGGGAGEIGGDATYNSSIVMGGDGGDGVECSISSVLTMYGGGGGGGCMGLVESNNIVGVGGQGGGANGSKMKEDGVNFSITRHSGLINSGGGGGGCCSIMISSQYGDPTGGNGGSGIVIISYPSL